MSVELLLNSLAQGVGWTAGWLVTMFAAMVFSEIRDWVFDRFLRKNGLK